MQLRTIRVAMILAATAIALAVSLSAHSQTRQVGTKWALLVGIDAYDYDITPLEFAVADVKALAKELKDRLAFDHITAPSQPAISVSNRMTVLHAHVRSPTSDPVPSPRDQTAIREDELCVVVYDADLGNQ